MTITAKDVFERAAIQLQDLSNTRWPLSEMRLWLNDGLREIIALKPNSNEKTVELALQEGSYQKLPVNHTALIRVLRNLTSVDGDPARRSGGRAITSISRHLLDTTIPDWSNIAVFPKTDAPVHVMVDMADPTAYHVWPANTGNGVIEAVVGVIPAQIAAPEANANALDTYANSIIDLPDIYLNPLVLFVISRCYGKELHLPSSAALAQRYMGEFNAALGVKVQSERVANVNSTGA